MCATDFFCRSIETITNKLIEDYIESQKSDADDIFKGNIL